MKIESLGMPALDAGAIKPRGDKAVVSQYLANIETPAAGRFGHERLQSVKDLRIAVIGTGYGARTILPSLKDLGISATYLVGGSDKEKTSAIAKQFNVARSSLSFDEMLAEKPDVIFLASPQRFHTDMLLKAKASTAHIVAEKPLGMTQQDVADVAEAYGNCGGSAVMNQALRFHPAAQLLRSCIETGQVGDLHAIECRDRRQIIKTENNEDGGIVVSMMSHFLDLAEFLADSTFSDIAASDVSYVNAVDVAAVSVLQDARGAVKLVIDIDGNNAEKMFEIRVKGSAGALCWTGNNKVSYTKYDEGKQSSGGEQVELITSASGDSPWKSAFKGLLSGWLDEVVASQGNAVSSVSNHFTTFNDYQRHFNVIREVLEMK